LRFNELRKAREEDRNKHPETYPPTHYWWPFKEYTKRCHYLPHDAFPTEEEVEFYRKVADDYNKGIVYRFYYYDTFLAYNRWLLNELDRWKDWEELGHIHSQDENLEQWKAHCPEEHHLHKEHPPYPPTAWESLGDLIRQQGDHMRDISYVNRKQKKKKKQRFGGTWNDIGSFEGFY
jgi:hypothetical protein